MPGELPGFEQSIDQGHNRRRGGADIVLRLPADQGRDKFEIALGLAGKQVLHARGPVFAKFPLYGVERSIGKPQAIFAAGKTVRHIAENIHAAVLGRRGKGAGGGAGRLDFQGRREHFADIKRFGYAHIQKFARDRIGRRAVIHGNA